MFWEQTMPVQLIRGGGVCIYIRTDMNFTAINLSQFCDEKNVEICSLKIFIAKTNIIVLCIYRSPCGNFEYFINKLDEVLKLLCKPKNEFILCGDFNVNFLEESSHKTQLLVLLQSYNVFPTAQFPTRITETTSSAIDNIFIDKARLNSCEVIPIGNGLSDHHAQCLVLKNFKSLEENRAPVVTRRLVNDDSIVQFLNELSNDEWEIIYNLNGVNEIFNAFLNRFLLVYVSSFLKQNSINNYKDNGWITTGICTSCRKRNLCSFSLEAITTI
jgi:hypothetical protein